MRPQASSDPALPFLLTGADELAVVADIFSGIQILISGCLFEGNRGPGILSSGAIGLTISSNYFVSDHRCASLLACLWC